MSLRTIWIRYPLYWSCSRFSSACARFSSAAVRRPCASEARVPAVEPTLSVCIAVAQVNRLREEIGGFGANSRSSKSIATVIFLEFFLFLLLFLVSLLFIIFPFFADARRSGDRF